MVRYAVRRAWAAAACTFVLSLAWGASQAQAQVNAVPTDQFGNYYAPGVAGGVGADLYPCPRPVPPWVGQTYITYQPLAPHEFMYHHSRDYVTYHDDGCPTRTHVQWGGTGLGMGVKDLVLGPNWQPYRKRISHHILEKGPN